MSKISPVRTNNAPEHGSVPVVDCAGAREECHELLRHSGFKEVPFGVTPNPAFLFLSKMHLAALNSMVQSIESNLGFTVLLGDPGVGKTTLVLRLLTQYHDSARTAFIFQTQCKRYELLRYLASELELPGDGRDEVSLHQRMKEMLVDEARARRKVLIFIDEAQNLHYSSLEALRLLSDFETAHAKLLHIILSGSSRLGERLLAPQLSQLAQRISTVSRLEPFGGEDVPGYIAFRLRIAGCKAAETLFSQEALAEVAGQSQGTPRLINSICYHALLLAHAIGERRVSVMLVRQAVKDLDLAPVGEANFNFVPPPLRREDRVDPYVATAQLHPPFIPELREQDSVEEVQFRPAPIFAAGVEQSPPQGPREKATMATRPEPEHILAPVSAATRHDHAGDAPYAGGLGIKLKIAKNDRSVFAVLVLLLLFGLAVWATWIFLRNASRTGLQAAEATAISAQNQDLTSLPFGILYSPAEQVQRNMPRRLVRGARTRTEDTQTVSQSIPPSKLRGDAATPTEEDPPAVMSNIPGYISKQSIPPSKLRREAATSTEADPTAVMSNIPGDVNKLTRLFAGDPLPPPVLSQPDAIAEPKPAKETAREEQLHARQPIRIVHPTYPNLAQLRHVEGDVILELRIGSNGKVQTARTLSGDPLLREAAEQAALKWQYPPLKGNQLPTFTVTRVRFNFTLHPEDQR
ncbi:MAG TPA: TonB family protein [Terriglobales bacterium]